MKRFNCGAGDGMYEDGTGSYVEYSEHQKFIDELFDLAYNCLDGLAMDKLYEIIEKYEGRN
jgi:hypothetical protein